MRLELTSSGAAQRRTRLGEHHHEGRVYQFQHPYYWGCFVLHGTMGPLLGESQSPMPQDHEATAGGRSCCFSLFRH